MSRAAGFADFFPAAPSVLAEKERARERALAKDAHTKDATTRGAAGTAGTSNASIYDSYKTDTSSKRVSSILTPNNSTSPPSTQLSPSSISRPDVSARPDAHSHVDVPPPLITTPKATPPAHTNPNRKDMKCTYDPELQPKGFPRAFRKPIYRINGGDEVCIAFLI